MILTLPIKTVSIMNKREHWAIRARRTSAQRGTAYLAVNAELRGMCPFPLPCIVTLTRIAPRTLDDDNLRGALKAVRDGIAEALGVDDRDPRVVWAYGQAKGAPKTFEVRVAISAARATERNPGATSAA